MGIFHTMKFTRHSFFMLGLASVLSLGYIDTAVASGKICNKITSTPAGEYCRGSLTYECPAGCYCTGGYFKSYNGDIRIKTACNEHWSNENVWDELDDYGIYSCDKKTPGFPDSASGKSTPSSCYYNSPHGNVKVYYTTVSCPPGQYLPRDKDSCVECSKSVYCLDCEYHKFENYYCPGTNGVVTPKDIDQGVKECGEGTVPSSDQERCIVSQCPSGKVPNEDQTACVIDNPVQVQTGYYLPANSKDVRQCTGTKYICPGGEFGKKSVDQGRYACPYDSKANADKTRCILSMKREQLANGLNGDGKCWIYTDETEFRKCIFGDKYNRSELPALNITGGKGPAVVNTKTPIKMQANLLNNLSVLGK